MVVMRYTDFILFLALVGGTVYNTKSMILRLILISLWAILPLYFYFISFRNKYLIEKKYFFELIIGIFIVYLLFISIVVNVDTFKVGFSGPKVEMLTAFLFLFSIFLFLFYSKLINQNFNQNFILYFYIVVVLFLIIDMVLRYFGNPGCFLNYACRHDSKVLGLFSNSNITGQITVFLIVLSWYLNIKYKKFFQILLIWFLFAALARSAWIALLLTYILSFFLLRRGIFKYILFFLGCLIVFILIAIDPLNLQNDGSGLSKLHFFIRTLEIIHEADWVHILFGFGASFETIVSLLNINGWSPHASILKAFLYYGLIGVSVYFYILYRLIKLDKRMLLPIFSYLIFGLAGAPIYWPTLSVGLILLKIDDNIRLQKAYYVKN